MFSKELENLIEATLQDGVITDQEKSVLLKRAQRENVDIDELDVYIQSLLQKRHQAIAEKEAEKDRESKMGNRKKCPNCGATVLSGSAICPSCGFAFNGIDVTLSSVKLTNGLQKLIDNSGNQMMGFITGSFGKEMKKKQTFIETFPVPIARADLLDLLSTLMHLSNPKGPINGWDNWKKVEDYSLFYWHLYVNCVNKARLNFSDDAAFTPFYDFYNEQIKKSKGFFARLLGK